MNEAARSNLEEAVIKLNVCLGEMLISSLEQGCDENEYPWVVFAIGAEEYAVNSKHVLSIAILWETAPVADAPGYCPGLAHYRNEMIRLLDMGALLGRGSHLAPARDENEDLPMMLVMEIGGERCGVIVDKIVSVEFFQRFIRQLPDEGWEDGLCVPREAAVCGRLSAPVYLLRPQTLLALQQNYHTQ